MTLESTSPTVFVLFLGILALLFVIIACCVYSSMVLSKIEEEPINEYDFISTFEQDDVTDCLEHEDKGTESD